MFTRAAIAAAMFCGATTSASAAQIVDQSNQGAVDREFQNMFTLGQSFTPTGTSIDFASFMIRATGTARMTAIVYAGGGFDGRLLGTSDAITVDTTYAMKQFTFAPIALVPGQLYTLRLSSSTGTFRARASADTYARGVYYGGSGFAAANIDLLFAEGFTVVPEPASWAMLVMGFGMMAGAARHRRRLGNATTA